MKPAHRSTANISSVSPGPIPMGTVNIGDAAKASGVSAKMIRHYESIGLIPSAGRTESGYRTYAESDLHRLRFVKRARTLGFSIKEIEALLALWGDRRRSSAKVKALTQKHIDELEGKIAEMQAMKQALQQLAHQCHGDDRPDCPILNDLAAEPNGGAQCH
jgi:MerR family transcriptional regulator, copper efflux regulator